MRSAPRAFRWALRFVSSAESPVHANYKNAILEAEETGTLVLNRKSTPCISALKSEPTRAIHGEGLMAPDALKEFASSISTAIWRRPPRSRANRPACR